MSFTTLPGLPDMITALQTQTDTKSQRYSHTETRGIDVTPAVNRLEPYTFAGTPHFLHKHTKEDYKAEVYKN